MATTSITPDQDAVIAEIFVAAPPERVFQAITDPAQTSQWWGQKGAYRVTGGNADVRRGGKWFSEGTGDDGTKFRVQGEYMEVDPPRLLVHTWQPNYKPDLPVTVVRWELEPRAVHGLQHAGPQKVGTGTVVKLRHSGFKGYPSEAASHGEGWKLVLGWMRAFAEEGATVESRS